MVKAVADAAQRTRGMSAEEVYKTLKSQIIRMELAPGTVIDDVALGA
jgi:DNA-binding GntR family transcriptional regulator